MSLVINSNLAATFAVNQLAYSNTNLQRSLARLASGSRLYHVSDDAAGLAVSMKLSAAAKRAAAAGTNVANATSYLQQQDTHLKSVAKVLERVSELWTLYQDETKTSTELAGYDEEYQALQQQLASTTTETFNGIALFGSTGSGVVELVRTSEDGTQTLAIGARDLASNTAGVGLLADSSGSGTLATVVFSTIAEAIERVAGMRAGNGAEQSRLSFAGEVLATNAANLEAANSRIADIDVATESQAYARWTLLVQSGAAMLAQANQNAALALKLLP